MKNVICFASSIFTLSIKLSYCCLALYWVLYSSLSAPPPYINSVHVVDISCVVCSVQCINLTELPTLVEALQPQYKNGLVSVAGPGYTPQDTTHDVYEFGSYNCKFFPSLTATIEVPNSNLPVYAEFKYMMMKLSRKYGHILKKSSTTLTCYVLVGQIKTQIQGSLNASFTVHGVILQRVES